VSDDAGLAAAGSGEEKHRAVDGEDSLTLLGVHVGEEIGHIPILSSWEVDGSVGRFGLFCEGVKNLDVRWNRGEWIDVRMSVMNLLNHGRRFVRSRICEKEEPPMKRLSVVTAMVLSASILTSEAMYAAPVAMYSPMHAMYSTGKLVKFNLHNATTAPIKVKAGETEMTLPPGQIVPVKLAVGAKVVVQEASTHYTQGSVVTVVSTDLSDATLTLN
jgi:hypothetical protein